MKLGIFGGSFDPIHAEHREYVRAAKESLHLDRVVVVPSYIAPHKHGGAAADGINRLEMCKIAFRDDDFVEVSDYELTAGGTSYTYLTCRYFKELYPEAELYFLVGADMLENFFSWRNPDDILKHVTLAACGRGGDTPAALHEKFISRFGVDFVEVPFTGEAVSSTNIRVALAFQRKTEVESLGALDPAVLLYINEGFLYQFPEQAQALDLEKPERRAHSYRVARMACKRARRLGIAEGKALLAAMLHDCAKNIPSDSPMIAPCDLPDGVPAPVVHQYTGAYLAEYMFGVADEEVLDAIRYHASGREDMTVLGKLIYLADLLEPSRNFPGVEALRTLFWNDLDACLLASFERQIVYLKGCGAPIYRLTERAYEWVKTQK